MVASYNGYCFKIKKPRDLLLVLSTTIILLCGTMAAPANGTHCATEFNTKLEELITLRKKCKEITYKDCCQIANSAKLFNFKEAYTLMAVHTINSVCNYEIQPAFSNHHISTVQALCDSNDGWLVILKRDRNISWVNFTRNWAEYENGFGDLGTEFWYGLKNIHCLTKRDEVELMIELTHDNGTGIIWTYQTFRVDGPETNYVLHIGGAERIRGSGEDNMAYHNKQQFTTIDRDNDQYSTNCASYGGGGSWSMSRMHGVWSMEYGVWSMEYVSHLFSLRSNEDPSKKVCSDI